MRITETTLRRILREEARRVRLFEAAAPAAPAPAAAPAAPAPAAAKASEVGGTFILGNVTAFQKYAPFSSTFLNVDGTFKTQQQMYSEIGSDLDKWGTTNSGDVTLIEAGGYFIGLAGYAKPDVSTINAAAKTTYSGTLDELLEDEEEGLFTKFSTAYDAGVNDAKITAERKSSPPTPAPTPAPAPTPGAEKTYTVVKGDTLSQITKRFYGDASAPAYNALAASNNIKNANVIQVNQVIKLPPTLQAGSRTLNLNVGSAASTGAKGPLSENVRKISIRWGR